MMLGAFADAFGFTATNFYALTLPQIAAYGRYLEDKADAMEHPDKRPAPARKSADSSSSSSIDNIDQFVMAFGSPESKQALKDRIAKRAADALADAHAKAGV